MKFIYLVLIAALTLSSSHAFSFRIGESPAVSDTKRKIHSAKGGFGNVFRKIGTSRRLPSAIEATFIEQSENLVWWDLGEQIDLDLQILSRRKLSSDGLWRISAQITYPGMDLGDHYYCVGEYRYVAGEVESDEGAHCQFVDGSGTAVEIGNK